MADWLEFYANAMEKDNLLSTTAEKLERLPNDEGWTVLARFADGSSRTLRLRHVVLAIGFRGGLPNMHCISGMVRKTVSPCLRTT